MSVANQANQKLSQLVTLTAKIESYLNPKNKGGSEKVSGETQSKPGKPAASLEAEASAVGGMAGSLALLIKETASINPKSSEKLRDFVVVLSNGVKDASKNLEGVDIQDTLEKIGTIVKGIANYSSGLTSVSLLSPFVMLGSAVFAKSTAFMIQKFSEISAAKEDVLNSIETIINMSKGIGTFALVMSGLALLSPLFAVGVTVFTLATAGMLMVFSRISGAKEEVISSIDTIVGMSRSIGIFALVMSGVALLSPLFVLGVAAFTLATAGMLMVFSRISGAKEEVLSSIDTILGMSRSIGIFSLVMSGVALLSPLFVVGVAAFTLATAGMLMVFSRLQGANQTVMDSIETITGMAKGIAFFSLAMIGIGLVAPLFAKGVLTFTLGIAGMLLVFNQLKQSQDDALNFLETITGLSTGIAVFSLAMIGVGLVAPIFAKGVIAFTLGIAGMMLAFNLVSKYSEGATDFLENIGGISTKIAIFALAMVGIGLVAPLFLKGITVFTLGVSGMLLAFKLLDGAKRSVTNSLKTITSMAVNIALFSVVMLGIGLVAPLFLKGIATFTLGISGMLLVFSLINGAKKTVTDSIKTITSMAINIAIFSVVMLGVGLVAPLFLKGIGAFTLGIGVLLGTLALVGSFDKQIKKAVNVIKTLTVPVLLLSLTFLGIGLMAKEVAIGALVASGSILVLGLAAFLIGKVDKDVKKGAAALTALSVPLILFTGALAVMALVPGNPSELFMKLGVIGAAIVGLGLAAYALGQSSVFPSVLMGALAMTALSVPLITFSGALAVLGAIPVPTADLGLKMAVIGAAIVGLGLAAFALGQGAVFPFVLLGALALTALTVPLIAFSGALAILGAIPVPTADLALKMAAIGAAIVGLGLAAFALGTPAVFPFVMMGTVALTALTVPLLAFSGALAVLGAIPVPTADLALKMAAIGAAIVGLGMSAFALGLPAVFPFVLLGAAALTALNVPLLAFTGTFYALTNSLKNFKEVGWTEQDGVLLTNAVTSTVGAFVKAFDGIGISGMAKLLFAVPLVGMLGNSLVSLAKGVKAMATLTFTETKYDEKTGKLVPVGEVRLTDSEIQQVGPNVASILNALAEPLTMFGKWSTMGETGFGPFTIGAGYMQKGIDAAAKVGQILTSLAGGVASMANLEVIEYEVVRAGTPDAKLVPKGSRKLTQSDFQNAASNVEKLLKGLAEPLVSFGKSTESGEGWFSDGYLAKGIDAAAKVSDFLAGLATGVRDMANLEVTEFTIVGKGTKDAKLVPARTRKLTDADFQNAAINVDKILKGLAKPLIDFGKATESGEGWFSDGYLSKGIDAIAKFSDPIAKLAKAVIDMSAGQATINEVVGGKLVPKSTISFAQAVPMATMQLTKLLNALPPIFVSFGRYYEANQEVIGKGIDGINTMASVTSKTAKLAEDYFKTLSSLDKVETLKTRSIVPFLTDLSRGVVLMGDSFRTFDQQSIKNYDHMVKVTERLSKIVTPFEKFTKSFSVFTKDMSTFVKSFEVFGKDNAENFEVVGTVIDKVAKVDTKKLKEALTALNEYAKQEESIAKQRQAREASQPAGSAAPNMADRVQSVAGKVPAAAPPARQAPAKLEKVENLTVQTLTVVNLKLPGSLG